MILYLIPTLLSENSKVISPEATGILIGLREFIVENEKSARHFLRTINPAVPQNELTIHTLNEHTTAQEVEQIAKCLGRTPIGLLSEAGCPAVADPGAEIVRIAHRMKIKVKPIAGPSSIILALMASGMNGQQFTFHGYLPRDSKLRRNKISSLEKDSKSKTQIFIETPYRNNALIQDILSECRNETLLCIATDITSASEEIITLSVAEWKSRGHDYNKRPAVFLISA